MTKILPTEGSTSVDHVAEAIGAAPALLGVEDIAELRSVLVPIGENKFVSLVSVLRVGWPCHLTEPDVRDAGGIILVAVCFAASELTSKQALIEALNAWRPYGQYEMSLTFHDNVNIYRHSSHNDLDVQPLWLLQLSEQSTINLNRRLRQGPFRHADSAFFAEDLGDALRKWIGDPHLSEQTSLGTYKLLIRDARAWLKDLSINDNNELMVDVERTTETDVVLTVSTTAPNGKKNVSDKELTSRSVSVKVSLPLNEIRVYLTDRKGTPYDDYRESIHYGQSGVHRFLLRKNTTTKQVSGLRIPQVPAAPASKAQASTPELFISHAATDSVLAEFLEQQSRAILPGVSVFRATRTGSIAAGKEWLREIALHLESADRFLILLTPWSLERPWIWFETGAAWIQGKTVVPVIAGGLTASDVQEPLRLLQLLSLENPEDARQAFKELGGDLADPATFAAAARTFAAKGRAESLRADKWEGVEVDGKLYAWDGPMDDFTEATPRGESEHLVRKLREKGLRLVMGIEGQLWKEHAKGYAKLYEVDVERRRRHPIISEHGQVMLAKWDPKP